MATHIELYGCREGNLKGIDVKIPYGKLTVVTGVSGSGKSSLAFRTVFAEGRRRIIESLDHRESYFIWHTSAPRVDLALGLPPAIAIRQTQHIRTPKSTLGSISHLNPFIYLLYAICGDIPCDNCSVSGLVQFNPPFATKCSRCGTAIVRLQPGHFSNMSPVGMCQECGGAGVVQSVDETLLYPSQELSISKGGLVYGGPTKGTMKYEFFNRLLGQYGFSTETPIKDLSQEAKIALLYGVKKSKEHPVEFPGLVPEIMKSLKETRSDQLRSTLQRFVAEATCTTCDGHGISRGAAAVMLDGTRIHEMLSMNIVSLLTRLECLRFNDVRDEIASIALRKAVETASTMVEMGIGYLTLSRQTSSLSGGEMHRARMSAQLASQISGVVYVLDEPSAGLHSEETDHLISMMLKLRDIGGGNTLLIVEHDAEIIRRADHIIELGPGPSRLGGTIVCSGTPKEVSSIPTSVTGKLLASTVSSVQRTRLAAERKKRLGIRHATSNNLHDVSVDIPLHCLVAVTGISGSGKSSLVFDSLCGYHSPGLAKTRKAARCELVGRDLVGEFVFADQSPISRNVRSVVATYVEAYPAIRRLFAATSQAKKLRLDQGYFSFNSTRGCCQTCSGYGTIAPESPLYGGAEFVCPACGGKRFCQDVLSVQYRGLSIADVLGMDVKEAVTFFASCGIITQKLEVLQQVGLGYLGLGESSVDLSGGEAQRLKLAVDLMSGRRKKALYVFDEPTAGLHAVDIRVLVDLFDRLLATGNSIIVVEHNLHLIWASDYIIEMGPGAGNEGGRVVATGTPQEVAQTDTATGRALRRFLS